MKPGAIAATLALHALAIGSFLLWHADQDVMLSRLDPVDIALVSNAGIATSPIPAAEAARIKPDSPSPGPSKANEHIITPPALSDAAGNQPANQVAISTGGAPVSPSGAGLPAAATKVGVSIPASYAASNPRPVYPLLARQQEEQGTVVLRILVKEDGSAGKIHVWQSSGYPLLDESALSAVQNWHFRPASVNNKPIAEWYQIAIPFKLRN